MPRKSIPMNYTEEETSRRRDAVIRQMLNSPPKPHSEMKIGKSKPKRGEKRTAGPELGQHHLLEVSGRAFRYRSGGSACEGTGSKQGALLPPPPPKDKAAN
jgi:hypothetical protein